MKWINPNKKKPTPKENVLILQDNDRIIEGYMNKKIWEGDIEPTYSFHGLYYDFVNNKYCHCLVNCIAWMPIPKKPIEERDLKKK